MYRICKPAGTKVRGSREVAASEVTKKATHIPRSLLATVLLCGLSAQPALAESCTDSIYGGWETEISPAALFSVGIQLEQTAGNAYKGTFSTVGTVEEFAAWNDGRSARFQSEQLGLTVEGRSAGRGEPMAAFVAFAQNLYRITLEPAKDGQWASTWSPLPVVAETARLDLFVDDDGEGGTGGYFFWRDARLPGMYGLGAVCSGRNIEIREMNLGLTVKGSFSEDYSRLDVTVATPIAASDAVFTRMSAERQAIPAGTSEIPARDPRAAAYEGEAPAVTGDGWRTAEPVEQNLDAEPLADLIEAVARGDFPNTHSVLLAKSGRLVFEEYFYGFDRDVIHDMRSAAKSLASTLIGLAIDRDLIDGADAKALSWFPQYRTYAAWDDRKADITIGNLLAMASGLDANDSDRNSVASEDRYQSQRARPDWIKLALDAPMIADPGTRVIYGSANPMILGGVLANAVGDRVEWFAEQALFAPLGIDSYRIFMDPVGVPYMGGGMHLKPRDMLKIGQMYLDGGRWQGRRVLSESWVVDSFGKYGRLEPIERNGNQYGYLWWHENYEFANEVVASVEARGNGGQYIFVLPEMDVVVVITAGNYRGGLEMTRQPQRIFRRYLLPALFGIDRSD